MIKKRAFELWQNFPLNNHIFLENAKNLKPLRINIRSHVGALNRRWSDLSYFSKTSNLAKDIQPTQAYSNQSGSFNRNFILDCIYLCGRFLKSWIHWKHAMISKISIELRVPLRIFFFEILSSGSHPEPLSRPLSRACHGYCQFLAKIVTCTFSCHVQQFSIFVTCKKKNVTYIFSFAFF